MSSLQLKVRQVHCRLLKSLCVRSASGVVRQVRQVSCKSLISLCVRLRQVCVHCVPHTPLRLRAPLGSARKRNEEKHWTTQRVRAGRRGHPIVWKSSYATRQSITQTDADIGELRKAAES